MHAASYTKFGPAAEVLAIGELPDPAPSSGEVRIRVEASGVNPVDVKRRLGGRGEMTSERVVPHFDGAGVIDALGDEDSDFSVGDRVWFYEAQWGRDLGSAAELVVLPESLVSPLPQDVSFAEGASLGIPALTAYQCVFRDGPVMGLDILVTGGAGGVGQYAVQFAKLSGARVIATVSTDEKADLAASCGADEVLRYKTENVAKRVLELTNGEGVDRIVEVELGGNLETSLTVLKPNGVIAAYASDGVKEPKVPFYQLLYKNVTLRSELVFLMSEDAKSSAVEDIGAWLESGSLRHHLGPSYTLERIVEAHEAVESGVFGKVVVTP